MLLCVVAFEAFGISSSTLNTVVYCFMKVHLMFNNFECILKTNFFLATSPNPDQV